MSDYIQIYHHHIPKTGGKYISNNLYESGINNIQLEGYQIQTYIVHPSLSIDYVDPDDFLNADYICGHFGSQPQQVSGNIKAFTTIRHPVDRVISHFAMIYFPIKLGSVMETFEHWLKDDEKDFIVKDNLQARFLTSKISNDFVAKHDFIRQKVGECRFCFKHTCWCTSMSREDAKIIWRNGFGIEDAPYSFESAKAVLNVMPVKNRMENMYEFITDLYEFVNDSFNCNLTFKDVEYPNKETSKLSKYIKDNLTNDQRDKILELNQVDLGLWENVIY